MANNLADKTTEASSSTQKRPRSDSVTHPAQKKSKQAPLKTFRGVDMPFSKEETAAVEAQVLRAVVSANLSFRAMENPEMLKLFGMLRTAAPEIIPSRKVIGGRLLNEAASVVNAGMHKILRGREVGVVYVSAAFQDNLINNCFAVLTDGDHCRKMRLMVFASTSTSR